MHLNRFTKKVVICCMLFLLLMDMGSVIPKADADLYTAADESSEETTTEEQTEAPVTTEVEKTTEKTTSVEKTNKTTEKTPVEKTTAAVKKKNKKKAAKATTERQIEASKVVDLSELEKEDTEEKPTGSTSSKIIPKVYNDHGIEMKNKKEMLGGFVYFNQGDSAWNDNGYHIKQAGCGPTSMAVVISSLTDQWVTPVDTTVWAYDHGFYSNAGSEHSLIPALSKKYHLDCKGVGRDISQIRKALKDGNPVVCLMGPGYFTKGGHFMVLVGIDDGDHVTVADVGSRQRSQYKYKLKDIISQSKSASAGGPFWVISNPNVSKDKAVNSKARQKREKTEVKYSIMKSADQSEIEETVMSGMSVMMMTDKQVIRDEEFIYITAVDSNHLATVTDKNFKNEQKCPLMELLLHKTSDLTGLSFWKVSGNEKLMMPFAQDK
ncbi:MAG: C39 family peptidase [Lachnospiraceae bacterium]|nr:C39 family peptidase [Lachnospiraceae bacterium]